MNAFITLITSLLLAGLFGCQTLAERQLPAAEEEGVETHAQGVDSRLLPDMVYSVLAGEVAAQRGSYEVAYKQYLYAARLGRNAELAELATQMALAAKDREAALEAVGLWVELDPKAVDAFQVAALLHAQAGDGDAALEFLRKAVALFEAAGDKGYFKAAALLAKIGDADLQLELMRRLAGDSDSNPEALFALAMVEAGAQNFEAAERLVRGVLAQRPGWRDARLLLVRILGAQHKTPEARKSLEEFLAQSPHDTTLRAAYARLLVEQEDLTAARDQFRRLLQDKPDDADSLFALGVLSVGLNRPAAARAHFRRLYDSGQRRDDAAYYLGQLAEEHGDKPQALDWYRKVRGGNLFDARVRIARILAQQGEVRQARELLQQMRSHAGGDSTQLYLIESEILRGVKLYDLAMEVLDEALTAQPDNHDLLYARAMLAVPMGRLDIMERDLGRIIEQDPKHADALNALGYTLADQTTRYAEAQDYIRRALALEPESAAVLDSMGWLQYRLGNNREALRYLWRAIELLPDGEIAAHLGEVLWAAGERERARQVWNEALAKDPDSEHVRRAMERLEK